MTSTRQQRIGPWSLGERLGRGGNGTVWAASRDGLDSRVALKLINVNKVDREPYQRFVHEIRFLRNHQDVSGILPLLDSNLPDEPSRSNQPWLAMPIATPIGEALQDSALDEVVSAVAAIADTLWRLQRDHGIAHRDIKPGNLYELEGAWLIGDFGLVAMPDTRGLTSDGRPLGPAHYTAYEMILDPVNADPHRADVYSLGKTLWVLATGQRFPPEGHQPVGTRGFEVGDFRPHAHAAALDQEIDVMTRLHPEDRPTKEQVAADLAAWKELATAPVTLDVSAARSRLRNKLSTTIAEQDTQAQQKELALAAVRRLQQLTAPLNAALKDLSERAEIDSATDKMTTNILKSHGWGGPEIVFRWHRCTIVSPLDRPVSTTLRMGRSLELRRDGVLLLHLMIHVGPEGVMGTDFDWRPKASSAPVGSIQSEQMLSDGVRDLTAALQEAIDVFVDRLPDPRPDA
jgi:serine/threonine protein kinase